MTLFCGISILCWDAQGFVWPLWCWICCTLEHLSQQYYFESFTILQLVHHKTQKMNTIMAHAPHRQIIIKNASQYIHATRLDTGLGSIESESLCYSNDIYKLIVIRAMGSFSCTLEREVARRPQIAKAIWGTVVTEQRLKPIDLQTSDVMKRCWINLPSCHRVTLTR